PSLWSQLRTQTRLILLRLIKRSRERGMMSTLKKTERALQLTQKRLERVERERQALLQQWSRLDSNLHKLKLHQQESRETLPPPFQTLAQFLEAREKMNLEHQQTLRRLQELYQIQQTPDP